MEALQEFLFSDGTRNFLIIVVVYWILKKLWSFTGGGDGENEGGWFDFFSDSDDGGDGGD